MLFYCGFPVEQFKFVGECAACGPAEDTAVNAGGREDGLEDGIIEGQERVKETATVDLLEALRLSGIDILDPVSITYDSIFGLTYSQGPFRYSPERY